jgi:DNA-binding transcriptional LysR family regulator
VIRASSGTSEFPTTPILEDRIELIVPAGHRAAAGAPVRLAALAGEPFIFFARSAAPHYHDRIMQACRTAGLDLAVTQEAESWGATLALVRAGFGVSIGTSSLRGAAFPGVAFCAIADPMPDVSFHIARDGARTSPLAAKVAAVLGQGLREAEKAGQKT